MLNWGRGNCQMSGQSLLALCTARLNWTRRGTRWVLFFFAAGLMASNPLWAPPLPQSVLASDAFGWEKYFVPDAPQPTFSFPVAHDHGLGTWSRFCSGYLSITRDEIQYEVLRPGENRDHGFQLPRQSVLEAGKWRALGPAAAAEFKFKGGEVYHFYLIHASVLDKDPHTLLTRNDVLPWPPVAQIVMRFDRVLAEVRRHLPAEREGQRAQLSPVPTKPSPAEGPRVRVMEPPIPDPSQPVEVTVSPVSLRGAAMDPKGVASVAVNDREAEMKSKGDNKAVEFSVEGLTLKEGLNRVNVEAVNTNHQRSQLTVLLWLHSKGGGTPTLPPPAPETPARASPSQKPLTEVHILGLLRNDISSKRLVMLIEQRGIDFEPSEDYIRTLRSAGAEEQVIRALYTAKRAKPPQAGPVSSPH